MADGSATVVVVGAGQMGSGIAQVFAQAGWSVLLTDMTLDLAERGRDGIAKALVRQVERGRISAEDRDATIGRITPVPDIDSAAGASLLVEAATERFELKRALFERADQVLGVDAILASNTSSISITTLGATTRRPERVIGMHFFNPAPVLALVEVVQGLLTADAVTNRIVEVARQLGKTPVVVKDSPGFIANRILVPMINEAIFALQEGIADAESIDTVMKLGMAHPMGPLALADLIGLDTCLAILDVLHEQIGDPKFRPAPLLRRMVSAGLLGRKSGRGFFSYSSATAT